MADEHGRTNCCAAQLRRSRGAVRVKGKQLCKEGLLESKNAMRRCQSIKPVAQDFDEVKRNYYRKHHITIAELGARFERDDQLAAGLYRLPSSQGCAPGRLACLAAKPPATGSSLVPTPSANGAPTRQRRP